MSGAQYERLATSPGDAPPDYDDDASEETEEREARPAVVIPPRDPRFDLPVPAHWKRAALIIFLCFLFWLAFHIPRPSQQPPQVVHATRYSKDYRFRPAASPVITEKLKDGRMRVRGAHVSH